MRALCEWHYLFQSATDDSVYIWGLPSSRFLTHFANCKRTDCVIRSRFVPQVINTEADLLAWLKIIFPLFTNDDLAKVLLYYPSTNASVSASSPKFATTGDSGPSALNQSDAGTGTATQTLDLFRVTDKLL